MLVVGCPLSFVIRVFPSAWRNRESKARDDTIAYSRLSGGWLRYCPGINRKPVWLTVLMVRRQSAANSVPRLFAKTKARFYYLFQVLNLAIQARCHWFDHPFRDAASRLSRLLATFRCDGECQPDWPLARPVSRGPRVFLGLRAANAGISVNRWPRRRHHSRFPQKQFLTNWAFVRPPHLRQSALAAGREKPQFRCRRSA
jgi:hypothetical protein